MRRIAVSIIAGALVLASVAFARPAGAAAWLGVYSQEITPELRDGMNYNGSGAIVTRVLPDSPADRGGLQRGDVITRVGGRDINSPQELADVVSSSTANEPVEVMIVRDGDKKSLRVTLGSHADAEGEDDDTPVPPPPGMHRHDGESPEPPEAPDESDAPEAPPAPRMHMQHGGNGRDFVMHLPNMSDMPGMGAMGMMGRGRLGVRIETLSPDLASYFGGRDVRGALVLEVTDGSAAEKAGIRAGDVISRLDGKQIDSAEDLMEAVRSGDGTVSISLVRHGAKQTVEAALGKAPEVMRLRGEQSGTNGGSQSQNGRVWQWRGQDGQDGTRRIVIDDGTKSDNDNDGDNDDDTPSPSPQMHRRMSADRENMDSLREQVQQLKEQIEQLRKELNSNR